MRDDNSNLQSKEVESDPATSLSSWLLCLEEDLDSEIYVILRDSRQFKGIFRSFDQYGSLCLEAVYEIISNSKQEYTQIYLGCMIFRGDSLMLCGLIDEYAAPFNAIRKPLVDILKDNEDNKLRCIKKESSVFEWVPDETI
ncbi:LSM domain-containing protein [Cryptosporidium muris RN66]|uniref:U6 snRNA-associated Sm-like protein LSm1 n=1 Tax=Cryptosporidium muris (strain RN66) TaxID=441375 RepID=B6AIW2_CRYMR|nr:LSM domain-containing protein [Cryptosporidium muris RN66]EEA08153.1 LSM domain-containing protein [Cryptosporidium muris RN66]|eukprot:XP_002142502.1 LSM domain-containing protein [Cryptosporidium muris RN66]